MNGIGHRQLRDEYQEPDDTRREDFAQECRRQSLLVRHDLQEAATLNWLEAALRRVFPQATKVGADILREAGWSTQIPSQPEVAVPQPGPIYAVEGFALTGRPTKWFAKVASGVTPVDDGLMRLQPAWALADMVARALDKRVRHAWLLAPDDLELGEARQDAAL